MKATIIFPPLSLRSAPDSHFFALSGSIRSYVSHLSVYDFNNSFKKSLDTYSVQKWAYYLHPASKSYIKNIFHKFLQYLLNDKEISKAEKEKILVFDDMIQLQSICSLLLKRSNSCKSQMIILPIYHTQQIFPALILAIEIRKKNPDIKIIYAGREVESLKWLQEYILKYNLGDFIIYFNPLCTIRDLIQGKFTNNIVLLKNRKITRLPIKKNPKTNLFENPVFYGNLDLSEYPSGDLSVHINFGCIGCCNFCGYNNWQSKKLGIAVKEDNEIINEIKHLNKSGKSHFHLDSFSLNSIGERRLNRILDKIIKSNLLIKWDCQFRLENNISSTTLDKMKKAGCVEIQASVETASDHLQKVFGKNLDLNDATKLIKKINEAKISFNTQFISGHPQECFEDFEESAIYLVKNRQYINELEVSPYRFTEDDVHEYLGIKLNKPEDGFYFEGQREQWKIGKSDYLFRTAQYLILKLAFLSRINLDAGLKKEELQKCLSFLTRNLTKVRTLLDTGKCQVLYSPHDKFKYSLVIQNKFLFQINKFKDTAIDFFRSPSFSYFEDIIKQFKKINMLSLAKEMVQTMELMLKNN